MDLAIFVRIEAPEPFPFRDRLMAGQQILNLHIKVQVLVPEPIFQPQTEVKLTLPRSTFRLPLKKDHGPLAQPGRAVRS